MDQGSVRRLLLRRMVDLALTGENEQACVAAARTAGEMIGILGARGKAMEEGEERRAMDMTPEEMRRELSRVTSVSPPGGRGGKGVQ